MVTGKIVDLDFTYEIKDEALDDYELLEILCDMDDGQAQKVIKAFKLLLGEKQLKELKEKVRAKCGRVSTNEMMSIFSLIMEQSNETKK